MVAGIGYKHCRVLDAANAHAYLLYLMALAKLSPGRDGLNSREQVKRAAVFVRFVVNTAGFHLIALAAACWQITEN